MDGTKQPGTVGGRGTTAVRRAGRLAGGVLLVLLGVAGLALPVLPGVPFLLAGGWLLGVRVPPLRAWAGARARRGPPAAGDA
jgi:uncharacterized membrane protein YbaN (DUF454 family)